jgi:GST-like protein
MAVFPWLAVFMEGKAYNDVREFLSLHEYPNITRWVDEIAARPAVKRGRLAASREFPERHSARDLDVAVAA